MTYGGDSIKVLDPRSHVRKNVGMYIDDTGEDGVHRLALEIIDNGVDEAMGGYADLIEVFLDENNLLTVYDNGRGIPTGPSKDPRFKGKDVLEITMTQIFAGGKFEKDSYKTSGGLHGIGMKAVCFLSEIHQVSVFKNGGTFYQSYEKGVPVHQVKFKNKQIKTKGTLHKFLPDQEIFGNTKFSTQRIIDRLKEIVCLVPSVTCKFTHPNGNTEIFQSKNGIVDMLPIKDLLATPIKISSSSHAIEFEACIAPSSSNSKIHYAFVNSIRNAEGGTHLLGILSGIYEATKGLVESDSEIKKTGMDITREDVASSVALVISARIAHPKFRGQIKEKLLNPEVQEFVQEKTRASVESLISSNKSFFEILKEQIKESVLSKYAQKQNKASKKKNGSSRAIDLPEKLSDCLSSNIHENEIFLVEGDSAGGSAKQGRDKKTQAVLPLRGKVLNVNKCLPAKIMANREVMDVSKALGISLKAKAKGLEADYSGLRYGKIIVATDADSDGKHIACLLIGLFYRVFPEIIQDGRFYISKPPLYRVKYKEKSHYFFDKKTMEKFSNDKKNCTITRFKGLGEMNPAALSETTLDKSSRYLVRINIEDAEKAVKAIDTFLGDDSATRKDIVINRIADFES